MKAVHFSLHTGDKVAVAGVNGSGKSSLLKIIAGLSSPDSGDRDVSPGTRIGYLPQQGIVHTGKTLLSEADTAFTYFHGINAERIRLEQEISTYEEEHFTLSELLAKHSFIMEQLENADYFQRTRFIETVLSGLGFSADDFEKHTEHFSGGWQMRIALAKILLSNPDFLLLDEPTNYLDLEARTWLEEFLCTFKGGYCVVSHDRFFLDATVTKVAEIFLGRILLYKSNYSGFEKERSQKLLLLEKEYEKQQQEIKSLEDFISRFRYNQSKAALVQSRIKTLEKIIPVEIPPAYRKAVISFPQPPHSGKHMVQLTDITKRYGSLTVLSSLSLEILRGEKIAIVGQNGTGKSTLMRILAEKDKEYEGFCKYGTGVTTGYFAQDFDRLICGSDTILEYMESKSPLHLHPHLRDMLGAFLFQGDDVYKQLDVLSGGEKSRLALLTLLLSPSNFLVLDEPTNHLDLHSKDVLLKALTSYTGTVVFVSHDRDFIDKLATKVLNLNEEPPKLYPGDYEYFLSQWSKTQVLQNDYASNKTPELTDNQLSREQRKRMKMKIRRLIEEETRIMDRLEDLDKEKTEINHQLALPSVYADGDTTKTLLTRLSSAEKEEELLHAAWESTELELSELKSCLGTSQDF
ncbi:MAG: ABC-F family ATP-binding cassette domain-containing protein [Spirochaetales bacterium]|nr:ABC-F family ATP-binding cassette domain-containing protein [Spirochaetales bacterium]